jgi:hypothetical protein
MCSVWAVTVWWVQDNAVAIFGDFEYPSTESLAVVSQLFGTPHFTLSEGWSTSPIPPIPSSHPFLPPLDQGRAHGCACFVRCTSSQCLLSSGVVLLTFVSMCAGATL